MCEGNQLVSGGFPSQRPVTRSFDVFFDPRLNSRDTGDLRHHRAHYDVIVMRLSGSFTKILRSHPSGMPHVYKPHAFQWNRFPRATNCPQPTSLMLKNAVSVKQMSNTTTYRIPAAPLTHWPLWDLYFDFKNIVFNLTLLISIFKSSYDNVLWLMPQDLTDDKSTLVQILAWCRQATSHYLNQCWPRFPTPYGVTVPQWVK